MRSMHDVMYADDLAYDLDYGPPKRLWFSTTYSSIQRLPQIWKRNEPKACHMHRCALYGIINEYRRCVAMSCTVGWTRILRCHYLHRIWFALQLITKFNLACTLDARPDSFVATATKTEKTENNEVNSMRSPPVMCFYFVFVDTRLSPPANRDRNYNYIKSIASECCQKCNLARMAGRWMCRNDVYSEYFIITLYREFMRCRASVRDGSELNWKIEYCCIDTKSLYKIQFAIHTQDFSLRVQ